MGLTVGQSNFTSIVTSGVRPDDAGGTVTMHNRLASGQRLELGGTGTYITGDGTTLTMVYINLVQTIGAGGDWTLTIADATVAAQEGGDITMTAGKGFTIGTGGDFDLTAGAGGTTTGAGGDFGITAGAGGDTGGAGGNVSIAAGAGTAGDANGGNVTILAGNAQGAGTDGTLGLGTSNTSALSVGATGITTTNNGNLTVSETFTANGNSDFGNAATDTVSFTAVVDSDVTFIKEVNRTLKVGASTTAATVGANLTIAAGDGTAGAANNGGNLALNAGNSGAGGTDGLLQLGTSNTSAITLGASTITTTSNGPLTVAETFTANGDVDLGNAVTDTLTITSAIDGDIVLIKEANRDFGVATSTTAATVGANLTIHAGGGTAGAANNGGDLSIRGGLAGAGGTNGIVRIGDSNTSSVIITPATTFTAAATFNGDVDLGNAATDTVSFTSVIDSDVAFIKEANRTFGVAASTTAATAGANLTIYAGDGTAGAANNGGNLALNAGNAGAGGVDGLVQVGTSNTSAVTLGAAGITTTNDGALTVTETFTANGDTDIGSAVTDTLTITSAIDGDIVLIKEAARDFGIATSTTAATVGANLTIHAGGGTAGAANNGGDLYLRAGLAGAGGTNGIVRVGDSNTSSVIITPATTFSGAVSAEGDVDLGNAATDTISFTGVGDTDLVFIKEVARTIKVAASTTADTVGANLTISAADGVGVAAGGDLQLDAGSGPGAGADGVLKLGTVNTSAITIGAAGITATNTGAFTVSETLTANGDTDIGSAVTDTLTILSAIDGDVVFLKEAARDLGVATSTTVATAGANLTIHAGGGTVGAANNGGDLYLRAGLAGAGGTDGVVRVGDSNTSSVIVTPSTTFSGAVSIEGDTDLGSAAADTVSVIGTVDTDLTFLKEVARTITVATSTTADTAGANLTVSAATGVGTGAGGDLALNGGSGPGAGADGVVRIGATNTSSVAVTPDTTFTGAVQIDGNTIIGNASTDTLAVNAQISTATVNFTKEVNHTIGVAASTTADTAGANLTMTAANGVGTGDGGTAFLQGGSAGGTGNDGSVEIGNPAYDDAAEVIVNNSLFVDTYFRVTNYTYTEDFDTVAGAMGAPQNQRWVGAGTNGTQTITADIGGTVRLATTAAGSSTSTLTWSQAQFHTNSAPRMFCRIRTDALTSRQIIAGWRVDANDYLYFTFDTAVDAANIYLTSRNNGAAAVITDTTIDLTAPDYFEFEIQIAADETFKAFINGVRVLPVFAGTIRELATFVPYFYIDNKAVAQDNTLDIDVVVLGQEREA